MTLDSDQDLSSAHCRLHTGPAASLLAAEHMADPASVRVRDDGILLTAAAPNVALEEAEDGAALSSADEAFLQECAVTDAPSSLAREAAPTAARAEGTRLSFSSLRRSFERSLGRAAPRRSSSFGDERGRSRSPLHGDRDDQHLNDWLLQNSPTSPAQPQYMGSRPAPVATRSVFSSKRRPKSKPRPPPTFRDIRNASVRATRSTGGHLTEAQVLERAERRP